MAADISMSKTILPDPGWGKDNFSFERTLYSKGFSSVIGCDEAGRGPLAGPVVAASVLLPVDCEHSLFLDSKVLTHKKRLFLAQLLRQTNAVIGIGIVSEQEIDTVNILQASLLAMKRAVQSMTAMSPDFILVDGKFPIPIDIEQCPLIKGESRSSSIAAASIIAKTERDRIMTDLHTLYPLYNFAQHKGYPTREHRELIATHGPCPVHRMSFKGVKEYVK